MVKNLSAMQETHIWSLGQEDPLEKGMATHSSILAWKVPWTEEPGRLQSIGSQRVRHDWATNTNFIIGHRIQTSLFQCKNNSFSFEFSSVQSLSHVRLFVTPWTTARQASLSITNSQSLPKPMSIESVIAIQPSHPLSSPSPPALNLSQHQGLFKWVSSLHQVAKVLELQPQH